VSDDSTEFLIRLLRAFGTEDARVEAKRASTDQLPQSCLETLCAFANTPGGGTLLLGIDEENGFEITGVKNPGKLQHDLAEMARVQLHPPLQPTITITDIGGRIVVGAEIVELSRESKPCYIATKGMNRGSFIRVGDGDRRLTTEEVAQLVADRGQPRFDNEVVEDAELSDLDFGIVQSFLARVRDSSPRVFESQPNEVALKMLNVVATDRGGVLRPTLAGLLALGVYPQQFFPQLCLTFVHYPSKSDSKFNESIRFIDNVRIDGPIPHIAREAIAVVRRNMSRRAFVTEKGRQDVWEYPPEALREAIVNALVHRDLSPGTRGTQVQIEMYPDRLRILNPGGLFGSVDITRLGEQGVSSSRNATLLRILEDVPISREDRTVCENRGSGIRTMRRELASAGMSPPEFVDKVTAFEVTMPNHTLFDEDTVNWLGSLGREGLKHSQCTALALMRQGNTFDNTKYRAATGVEDSRAVTSELQDLVAKELVEQQGERGRARYVLSEYAKSLGTTDAKRVRPNRRQQIVDLLGIHGDMSKVDISIALNLNQKTTEYWLAKLKKEGEIVANRGGPGNKNTRYRRSARYDQADLFALGDESHS